MVEHPFWVSVLHTQSEVHTLIREEAFCHSEHLGLSLLLAR